MEEMESKVKVTRGKGLFSKDATLKYKNENFIVYIMPKWPQTFFGLVGKLLAEEKEKYRFHKSQIEKITFFTDFEGCKIYIFYLKNSKEYTIKFDHSNDITLAIDAILKEKGGK